MSAKFKKHVQALSRHPKLKKLIEAIGPLNRKIPASDELNEAVLSAIVSQQVSFNAAKSITNRLLEHFGSADKVIKWAMKQPKGPAMGLSGNKVRALAEWGRFERQNKDIATRWRTLEYAEYKKEVSKIWGLGPWTADMIAIFHLGRMDVWPAGDAGVVKGAKLIFGTTDYAKISKYIKGSETLVCLYFWEMISRKIHLAYEKR